MATHPHPNKHPSVNHSNILASLLLCEALSHTLLLLTSLTDTSAPWLMSVFTHSTDLSLPALWRGVWGKEENVVMKEFFLPFSLSLSLSYQLLSHSLSLSLHFSVLTRSLNTRKGHQWKKHLPSEKACQTSRVFMMRHIENAKHKEMEGKEREIEREK